MRSTETIHSGHTVTSMLEALKPHHTRNSWRKWDIVLGKRHLSGMIAIFGHLREGHVEEEWNL